MVTSMNLVATGRLINNPMSSATTAQLHLRLDALADEYQSNPTIPKTIRLRNTCSISLSCLTPPPAAKHEEAHYNSVVQHHEREEQVETEVDLRGEAEYVVRH
eukprot:Hpha_TRINITY_DN10016_c0_g1::TRINITY_DN10016_c0_g1_i1::g.83946::m.83946